MESRKTLTTYIRNIIPKLQHEGKGFIKHPFLSVTCSKFYGRQIFVWDNHHMAMRLAHGGKPEYFRYQLENFFSNQVEDGFTPSVVDSDLGPMYTSPRWQAQPYLAQGAYLYLTYTNDLSWCATIYEKLKKYLAFYEKTQRTNLGLFRWALGWMSGFDNDVCSTMFQQDAIVSPDINSLMYLEYLAMSKLSAQLNRPDDSKTYAQSAETLKQAINQYLWNEEHESYLSYNMLLGRTFISLGDCCPGDPDNSGDIGQFAFMSCSNLLPLYAHIASNDQAEKMIKRYIINPAHFWSDYGIRSLSRSSEYYNNAIWGNPPRSGDLHRLTNSNWQGPVWIPLNYFVTNALARYGFKAEAELLSQKTMNVLLNSLNTIGSFSENFDGDNGSALYCREFASWNILADQLLEEVDNDSFVMDRIINL